MTLTKQLWISLLTLMLISFGGTLLISTLGARTYLRQQLYLKNQDNAASLALAISQMDKDPVTLELLVSANFDSGHYRLIRLTDPAGKILVERINPPIASDVPPWFIRLIAIDVEPGIAQIQDGWRQFATITLLSHDRFAYRDLWQESLRLLAWFAGGLLVCGLVGTLIIRRIIRPVSQVVDQAEAIGERRFITIPEPVTLEFKRIVRAMNTLSGRVRTMLKEESQRLEKLRLDAYYDSLTGVQNRQHFLAAIEAILEREDACQGSLAIGRISGLDELNRELGREVVDQVLGRLGERLQKICETSEGWVAGRLAGADFALLAPEDKDAFNIAHQLAAVLHLVVDDADFGPHKLLPVGGTAFVPGEKLSALLSRADSALIMAERTGGLGVRISVPEAQGLAQTDLISWRQVLHGALENQPIRLAAYPVLGRNRELLHCEGPVRLLIDNIWQPAAVFIPWVARLGLLAQLDTLVVRAALEELETCQADFAVHISGEALRDDHFRTQILLALKTRPALASRLWLEIPESAAFYQKEQFRSFCAEIKPFGCQIGLEHVGHHFSRINEFFDLGLDFIKIDAALIRGATDSPAHQVFLRGLCTIAHSIGLKVIAEGVREDQESTCLIELGFDGMTGPGIQKS